MQSVLVVEDDDDLRETVVEVLRGSGYQATGTPSGEDALSVIGSHAVDLVLSDFDLPGMNGIDLLKQLRRLVPSIRVVIMTGSEDVAQKAMAAREVRADGFVHKPADPQTLLQVIEVCVGGPKG